MENKMKMKIWDGRECGYDTHMRLIQEAHDYMSQNPKATEYMASVGDTMVLGTRDTDADCFEIFDLIIRRSGVFKNPKGKVRMYKGG